MSYILLIVGFVCLIKGADFFVEGSSGIAKKLRVPSMIIGMTIVAMGTSLPECAVSVTASLAGNNALAVSNVVGSNIFNLMVVCGCCAVFAPLAVGRDTLRKDFPFSILVAVLLLGLGYFGMALDSTDTGMTVGRIDGIILLVVFAIFLLAMIRSAMRARSAGEKLEVEEELDLEKLEKLPVWKCLVFIAIGIVGIAVGGDLVVDSASTIATNFGLSQNLIGLTIVALGTSLPELVTSIVAARKNEVDMALGNVIGSNIFNILLVLGVAAAISPVGFIVENIIDLTILIVMSVVVLIFAWSKKQINRTEGILMLAAYVGYMVYICMR